MPRTLCALLLAASALSIHAASAQERLDASALTGIRFPEQSWAWNDDEAGTKRQSIEAAAAVAGRSCGEAEFHAFQTSDPDSIRSGTTAAFEQAGWTIEDFSQGMGDQHIYKAAKDGSEVVMTWFPVDSGAAFFLCQSFPQGQAPAQPEQTAQAAQPAQAEQTAESAQPAAKEVDDDSLDFSQAPWVFTAVFGAMGAFILGSGIRSRRRAKTSLSWSETRGKILQNEVVYAVHKDADGDTDESWTPKVLYSYDVGGQAYQGSRIRFGEMAQGSEEKAATLLAAYPVGAEVAVRYNPDRPADATLETTKPKVGMAIFIGGIFLFFAACAALTGLGM